MRILSGPGCSVRVFVAALIGSPLIRHANFHWMTPTNTLIHLDGIAWGSLLALGLYRLPFSRRTWTLLGLAGMTVGFWRQPLSPEGPAFSIRRSVLPSPAQFSLR